VEAGLQIAVVSAGAAILGTLGGALTTFLGTKRIGREQWRLSQIDKEITEREKLYSEFMGEVSLLSMSAIDKKTDTVADFARLYALLSGIKIVATKPVIDAAARVARQAVDAHSVEGLKLDGGQPLGQPFSEACRVELDALRVKAFRKVD
jgi:hypothetical protein